MSLNITESQLDALNARGHEILMERQKIFAALTYDDNSHIRRKRLWLRFLKLGDEWDLLYASIRSTRH